MKALKDKTLADRIQGLARELQDLIFDFTIAIEPTTVHVTRAYKVPWQLSINRATRKIVAEMYYEGCTFVWRKDTESEMYLRWLQSLPDDHHAMIHKIRLCDYSSDAFTNRRFMIDLASIHLHHWCLPVAARAGNLLSSAVFWTNVNSFDELGYRHQIWVQLQIVDKMREDPYWSSLDFVVHSWKQPPLGYAWDRSY